MKEALKAREMKKWRNGRMEGGTDVRRSSGKMEGQADGKG